MIIQWFRLSWTIANSWLRGFLGLSSDIYREANSCADCLANMGRLQNSEFVGYSSPPVELLSLTLKGSALILCFLVKFMLFLGFTKKKKKKGQHYVD